MHHVTDMSWTRTAATSTYKYPTMRDRSIDAEPWNRSDLTLYTLSKSYVAY